MGSRLITLEEGKKSRHCFEMFVCGNCIFEIKCIFSKDSIVPYFSIFELKLWGVDSTISNWASTMGWAGLMQSNFKGHRDIFGLGSLDFD